MGLDTSNIQNCNVNTFREMLKSVRLSKNITQKELASEIDFWKEKPKDGRTSISDFEQGHKYPDIKVIYALSDALDIDKDSLFDLILCEKIRDYYLKSMSLYNSYLTNKECKFNLGFSSPKKKMNISTPKTAMFFKEARFKRKFKKADIKKIIKEKKGRDYSLSFIRDVEDNVWPPSVHYLSNFFESIEENPFPVFKILVKEKLSCHVREFQGIWDDYKKIKNNIDK